MPVPLSVPILGTELGCEVWLQLPLSHPLICKITATIRLCTQQAHPKQCLHSSSQLCTLTNNSPDRTNYYRYHSNVICISAVVCIIISGNIIIIIMMYVCTCDHRIGHRGSKYVFFCFSCYNCFRSIFNKQLSINWSNKQLVVIITIIINYYFLK